VVVDVDLEKFFDRVGHDILIDRLRKRIADRAAIRLIRAYLDAGTLVNGVIERSRCGAPQGSPRAVVGECAAGRSGSGA
jgi:retron-type reverse transcriptase